MKSRGVRAARWSRWQKSERAAVVARCDGVCEWLHCEQPGTDLHHCYGRKSQIAEPWASWRLLTTILCRTHHDYTHEHQEAKEAVRWAAVTRLALEHYCAAYENPLDIIREFCRTATFDPQEITQ